ncbi:hypothetical protein GA0070622_0643 [Micromonospora sediminicola]|uniref:N-acetyltransferase domain-containing protein n=1 Tax=Micromonospora sediminicola TaxID=946078 RepID=A0A1A9B2F8_9ACTN|nr:MULTISPECIES: hypothetical protein [Micromonospora]PGH41749.1 hypothetical protein COO58_24770 [Micromonospora sp. WMMA1996]SBT63685.1 hypothetical protein GA0070622_0643 [Micromonospora sediminicola]
MTIEVDAGYLSRMAEVGALRMLDGSPVVAGAVVEPVTGESYCLVEYCDDRLLVEPRRRQELLRHLAVEFPDAARAVVRASAGTDLPPPWAPHLTYVRHRGVGADEGATVEVRAAEPADDHLIEDWLARALIAAAPRSVDPARPVEVAAGILAAPDRRSYVTLADDRPVGHVTLLLDALDDVTGRPFVELLDILVEPRFAGRAVTDALVAASATEAAALGRPLLGHVVHGPDQAHGDRVVCSLIGKGWVTDHRFHTVALERATDGR